MPKEENILLNRFYEFVKEKKLINSGEKILLTVSGGMDSSVMTHLFSKTDYNFGIAHCNFSLRGNESDTDAEFVSDLADKYNKTFHNIRFDTQNFAEKNKFSIQEAARILRYQWFEKISTEFTYNKISTAHQLDDSIETFFINLLRGTGTAGLRGISFNRGKIIRPLLFASRKDIEDYAYENKIDFREDSSNASDDYLRNRIRHHVIPVIKANAEGFEDTMENLMQDFSLITEIINDKMAAWKQRYVEIDEAGNFKIPLAAILNEKNVTSFLSLLLYSFGITGIDCKKILSVETAGKIFHGKNYSILHDREFLILQKKGKPEMKTYIVSEVPKEIQAENMIITLRNESQMGKKPFLKNIKSQQIDGEKITFPLTLRTWKTGDYFFPLGMKGKKKISDFFTDEKIDRFQKDKIYLLLSGNDIVCILGHRIDDRYKITSTTKKVLTIELSIHEPGTTTL